MRLFGQEQLTDWVAGRLRVGKVSSPCLFPPSQEHLLFFCIPLSPLDLGEPPASDPKDPKEPPMQKPPGSPLVLPHTLQELLSKDTVQVQLIPEKKGLFLKHVEYEVSSKVGDEEEIRFLGLALRNLVDPPDGLS